MVRARSRNFSMSQAFEMSVRNGPGWMQLTRTFGPNAWAKPTVMALMPALAAEYGIVFGVGRDADVLDTMMIEPPSPAAIRAPTTAVRRNGPFRFTSRTLS